MTVRVLVGDCIARLRELPANSVHCVCTSPPYFALRSYLPAEHEDKALEIGSEPTPELWAAKLVEVFREVRRVLRDDGAVWLNVGDSYSTGSSGDRRMGDPTNARAGRAAEWRSMARPPCPGMKPKDLIGAPWLLAFALRADGWWLRSDVCWAKKNCMPESISGWAWSQHQVRVPSDEPGRKWKMIDCPGCAKCEPHGGLWLSRDSWRPTKSHETVFMLAKSETYFADAEAVREAFSPESAAHWRRYGALRYVNPTDSGQRGDGHQLQSGNFASNAGRNLRSVWTIATEPLGDIMDFDGADYVDDRGIPRRVSPDCPVHGPMRQPQQETAEGASCDGQPNHLPIGTEHNGNDLALEPAFSVAPTSYCREKLAMDSPPIGTQQSTRSNKTLSSLRCSGESKQSDRSSDTQCQPVPSMTDCVPLEDSLIAISNSSRMSKIDHALVPVRRDSAYVGTALHTQSTSTQPSGNEPSQRTAESNISEGGASCEPENGRAAQSQSCRSGTSTSASSDKCSCAVSKFAHFAAFPQELVRRCILAGTSQRGCCANCGSPWARVVERESHAPSYRPTNQPIRYLAASAAGQGTNGTGDSTLGMVQQASTIGWRATCACDAGDPVPCTVLDCFGGSGTTGLVADQIGRDAILIELSPEYAAMSEKRIQGERARRMIGNAEPRAVSPGQAELFALDEIRAGPG